MSKIQKIVPCLWFDRNCEEAMNFYVSIFSNFTWKKGKSKIISIQRYEKGMETPGIESSYGLVLTGIFELEGFRIMALDGGPIYKINPSISFMLNFDPSENSSAKESLKFLWDKLSDGSKILMPLQKYPFSEYYGWVQDKFGVTWQLILTDPKGEKRPFIIPSLMFTGDNSGNAQKTVDYYLSVFKNSKMGIISRYGKEQGSDLEGKVAFCDFMIENQWFAAMDSGKMHDFTFNEAVSLTVDCKDQHEIDLLWTNLSNVPESEQCGWLKDKFGISWQIVPTRLGELLSDPDTKKAHRVLNAMLNMKKIIISDLEKAYRD